MNIPTSVAIRTAYFHHSQNAGYKQILKYTKPQAIFGIDENATEHIGTIWAKYLWLNEWKATQYIKQHKTQLLHILYGEEYYRFAARLVNVPIVVTYHQPPDILQQEIETGDYMGRVSGWAHRFNKSRFQKLSAAIVMTEAQKQVLSQVVASDKIFVLPLGADLESLTQKSMEIQVAKNPQQILTVGEWQRDWDFYFEFVNYCQIHYPDWKFVLVNRKLQTSYKENLPKYPNLVYYEGASDMELYTLYKASVLQFLPFKGAAGNNSMNESLALGCPIVTNVLGANYQHKDQIIALFDTNNLAAAAHACSQFLTQSPERLVQLAKVAQTSVRDFDWKTIGNKTIEIYHHVL